MNIPKCPKYTKKNAKYFGVSLSNYLYFPDLGVLNIYPILYFNMKMSSDVKSELMVNGAKDPDLI